MHLGGTAFAVARFNCADGSKTICGDCQRIADRNTAAIVSGHLGVAAEAGSAYRCKRSRFIRKENNPAAATICRDGKRARVYAAAIACANRRIAGISVRAAAVTPQAANRISPDCDVTGGN